MNDKILLRAVLVLTLLTLAINGLLLQEMKGSGADVGPGDPPTNYIRDVERLKWRGEYYDLTGQLGGCVDFCNELRANFSVTPLDVFDGENRMGIALKDSCEGICRSKVTAWQLECLLTQRGKDYYACNTFAKLVHGYGYDRMDYQSLLRQNREELPHHYTAGW